MRCRRRFLVVQTVFELETPIARGEAPCLYHTREALQATYWTGETTYLRNQAEIEVPRPTRCLTALQWVHSPTLRTTSPKPVNHTPLPLLQRLQASAQLVLLVQTSRTRLGCQSPALHLRLTSQRLTNRGSLINFGTVHLKERPLKIIFVLP